MRSGGSGGCGRLWIPPWIGNRRLRRGRNRFRCRPWISALGQPKAAWPRRLRRRAQIVLAPAVGSSRPGRTALAERLMESAQAAAGSGPNGHDRLCRHIRSGGENNPIEPLRGETLPLASPSIPLAADAWRLSFRGGLIHRLAEHRQTLAQGFLVDGEGRGNLYRLTPRPHRREEQ